MIAFVFASTVAVGADVPAAKPAPEPISAQVRGVAAARMTAVGVVTVKSSGAGVVNVAWKDMPIDLAVTCLGEGSKPIGDPLPLTRKPDLTPALTEYSVPDVGKCREKGGIELLLASDDEVVKKLLKDAAGPVLHSDAAAIDAKRPPPVAPAEPIPAVDAPSVPPSP